MKFSPITRILVLVTPIEWHSTSFSCFIIGKTSRTNTTARNSVACSQTLHFLFKVCRTQLITNKFRGAFTDRKNEKKTKTTSVYRLVTALGIQPKYNSSIIISPFGAIGTGILLACWGEAEAARIIGCRLCSGGFPDIAGSTCLSTIVI